MAKVAILGVGKMGSAMAQELVSAGHTVVLWNRTKASADKFAEDIASDYLSVADTVTDALVETDIAITTFTDGKVNQMVLLSETSLLASAPRNLIIIDMGTSGIDSARKLDKAITGVGLRFIDAPVSGSVATVHSHQLLVMASGSESAVEESRQVLSAFAKKVAFLGAAGAGQAMKLSVNLIVHSLNAALSEALALAAASGIADEVAYSLFEESVIAAPFVKYKRSAFLDENAPVAMRIDTVLKDLELINALGIETGVPLAAALAVEELYRHACEAGFEAKDMASLVRFLHPERLVG